MGCPLFNLIVGEAILSNGRTGRKRVRDTYVPLVIQICCRKVYLNDQVARATLVSTVSNRMLQERSFSLVCGAVTWLFENICRCPAHAPLSPYDINNTIQEPGISWSSLSSGLDILSSVLECPLVCPSRVFATVGPRDGHGNSYDASARTRLCKFKGKALYDAQTLK